MEHQRLANKEAELLLPPLARYLRYQGKEELRYPDAVRHRGVGALRGPEARHGSQPIAVPAVFNRAV